MLAEIVVKYRIWFPNRLPRVLTVSTPTAYLYGRERNNNHVQNLMTRLNNAQDRLERALSRLEKASGKDQSMAQPDDGAGNKAVPADEFELLRARYDKLHGVTRKISDRLDAAVDRMKTALDG
jgi:hypothetical protein